MKGLTIKQWYAWVAAFTMSLLFTKTYNKVLMALSQADATATLQAYDAQMQKINAEVLAVQQALADAQAAGQVVSPALEAAINSLGASITAVDNLNPDAPVV